MALNSALSAFLARLNYPVLSAAEESQLFLRFRNSEGDQKKQIRTTILNHNLRLVVHFCKEFKSPHGQKIPLEDLIQSGFFGLNRAVDLFDPGKGCKFSTYARYWIFCFLQQEVVDNYAPGGVRLQSKVVQARNRLHRELPSFLEKHGRHPNRAEIKAMIGRYASVEQVRLASIRYVSGDLPVTEESTLLDTISSPEVEPLDSDRDAHIDLILEQAGQFTGVSPHVVQGAKAYLQGDMARANQRCWFRMVKSLKGNGLATEFLRRSL